MGLFGERKPKLKDFDNPKLDIITQQQWMERRREIDSQHYMMHLSSEYRRELQKEWDSAYNNQPHLVRAREAEYKRNKALEQQRLLRYRAEREEREFIEKYPFAKRKRK